jgi:hypothetical protein
MGIILYDATETAEAQLALQRLTAGGGSAS